MSLSRKDASKVVEKEICHLLKALHLQDWKVEGCLGRAGGSDSIAEVGALDEYKVASITVDPERHDSLEEIAESVRHEVFHLLLAPFQAYRAALRDANGEEFKDLPSLWDRCEEEVIRRLERTDLGK